MAQEQKGGIMPNVTFEKSYIYRLVGKSISDERLEDQIMKMGLGIEARDEKSITIEVDANRPDLLDPVGFARALRNFMHINRNFSYKIEDEVAAEVRVGRGVAEIRPYIAALVVKGLKLDEVSLRHLINFTEKFCDTFGRGRKKIAIGLHDFSKVKPPIQYDAFPDETFVALGGVSSSYSKIVESHEKGIKYRSTISSSKKLFPAIKDSEGTMALIPILNSERTRVTEKTTEMFIDITGTENYFIGKTADMMAAMFIDMGAKVYRVSISYPNKKTAVTPEMKKRIMNIPLIDMELQIGTVIGFNNVISLANKMGYEAALVGKKVRFYVPPYRLDILNEQDITEDIAIAYGYEYIKPIAIYSVQQGGVDQLTQIERKIAAIMTGMGFDENSNYYLTNEKVNYEWMRLAPDKERVRIKNAKSAYITMARTSVLPSLLGNLGKSSHESMPQKLFEFDMTFSVQKGKPIEKYSLGAVMASPKSNFNDIKAVAEAVLHELYGSYSIEQSKSESFIEGRCAKIVVEGKQIGIIGEIHPEVLSNFGVYEPTFAIEINVLGV